MNIAGGVDDPAVFIHFEMDMGSGGESGRADFADRPALTDILSASN